MKFWFYILSFVLTLSCAIESRPTGGDKDVTPPEVVNSVPDNFSTQFNSTTISITFDEYVELKNFNQQFSISPPLENKPKNYLKGKTLLLEIEDSLAPNTTYTLNFGNSIIDITEGNPQTDFKYVFSTGEELDSLFIHGYAKNAQSGSPIQGALALLFGNHADSAAYKNKPLYYAVTKEDGSFNIENISTGPYHLVVIDDQDFNFKISGDNELIGFVNNEIDPLLDSLYTVNLFKEIPEVELVQSKQDQPGKGTFYYTHNVPDNYKVWQDSKEPLVLDFREGRDTITAWFTNRKNLDTILLFAQHNEVIDTIWFRNSDIKSTPFSLSANPGIVKPNVKPVITGNKPIIKIDETKVVFVKNTDTVNCPSLNLSSNQFDIEMDIDPVFGEGYALYFYPGFVQSLFETTNDTGKVSFATKKETDYAYHILELHQKDKNQHIIVQLLTEDGDIVMEEKGVGDISLDSPNLDPASYTLRVILDDNNNGLWDAGNYIKQVQPERIIYYPDLISLRANWEIETIWNLL